MTTAEFFKFAADILCVCVCVCVCVVAQLCPVGVQPRWVQGNLKERWNWCPKKNLFNYRYRERLKTDSVVGKFEEKKRLNNLVYVKCQSPLCRPQASFHSPEREEALRPPWSDLRSPGKISRLGEYPRSRWEFSQKGKERTTWGNQSFQKLIRFLYFSGLFIYRFVIHRDEYRVT